MKRPLSSVANRQGRLDVLLYQCAELWMERLEIERGLVGLRQHLLPMIEEAIVRGVPAGNLIPQELRSMVAVCEQNLRRGGC